MAANVRTICLSDCFIRYPGTGLKGTYLSMAIFVQANLNPIFSSSAVVIHVILLLVLNVERFRI